MFSTTEVNSLDEQSWERRAFEAFEQQVAAGVDDQFPCVFGVEAMKRGTLRFAFYESLNLNDIFKLSHDLKSFLRISRTLVPHTSYVAFFSTNTVVFESIGEYENAFWRVLNMLNAADPATWPDEIGTHIDTPSWEFTFSGEPIFVVCNTPLHRSRRSRYALGLTITFQPRWVFDKIASGTRAGNAARAEIRRRLENYDSLPPFPGLGAYGDPANREWVQYFLPDDNKLTVQRCPMVVTNKPSKPDKAA